MTESSQTSAGGNWLQCFIVDAVSRAVCTEIHCTTCGATEFRQGLLAALALAGGRGSLERIDQGAARLLAVALRELEAVGAAPPRFEKAVRFVLFEVWHALWDEAERHQLEADLAGTWAGGVLARMQAHHQARIEARRRHDEANDPERIRQSRQEKRRVKQEQHAQRLALKTERDRVWREKQRRGGE